MKKIQFKNSTIDFTKLLPLVAVITLFTFFSLRNSQFLGLYNIGNILDFANTYFIAGIGLTFVILIGSIDLSIGAMISLDTCLLYTSDAADEEDSVDLGVRRIIKK